MMGRLQDKIAVITGGASGIGEKMSELFVKEGATVIAADINEAALEKVKNKENMQAIRLDVSNEDDWKKLVEQVEKEHGKIDILVNNAGVTSEKMLNSIDYKDWEDRKSTRLNSSHVSISYAVFCLKKKKK